MNSPRYASTLPPYPPPPYKQELRPGGPTPTFFPTPEDPENLYSSVGTRPLPTVPKIVEECDYEDGYILKVDSIPVQNELPGIMIGNKHKIMHLYECN